MMKMMKRILFYLLTALFAFSSYVVRPALAQSEPPPPSPTGEIRRTIMNRNSGKVVAQSLEVMLHILDKDFAEKDMKHAQSQPDGTFVFADVPFDASLQFAVMAIYDGVTYFSDTAPADMTSLLVVIEVPVYESTSNLASIQVDQMHVLFDIAEDGLEIKEIYAFSNSGERTVKDVYDLGNDQFATLQFPLPSDADYIFFKPEDKDRFVKLNSGFADTYPILPGTQSAQLMVSYLVPYSGEREYTYAAPVNIARINFLIPDQTNLSLKGTGLSGPESMDLQNGGTYLVYSYSALNAGQTVSVSISEKAAKQSRNKNTNTPIAVGAAFLGFVVVGMGIWWWRRPDDIDDEGIDPESDSESATLDELIVEIARLDEAFEQNSLNAEEYQHQRQILLQKAKHLS